MRTLLKPAKELKYYRGLALAGMLGIPLADAKALKRGDAVTVGGWIDNEVNRRLVTVEEAEKSKEIKESEDGE